MSDVKSNSSPELGDQDPDLDREPDDPDRFDKSFDLWDRLTQAEYDEAGRMAEILRAEMRMGMNPGEGYAPAWMFPPDYVSGRTVEPSPTQVHNAPPQALDSRSALTVESDTTDPLLLGDEPSIEPVSHPDDPDHVPDEAYRHWLVAPPREDRETEALRELNQGSSPVVGSSEPDATAELNALLLSWSQRDTPRPEPLPPPPEDAMTDIDYVWGPSYVDEDPSVRPSGFLTPIADHLEAFQAESADLAAESGVVAQTGMDSATDNARPVDPRFDGSGVRALRDLIRDTGDADAIAALNAFASDRANNAAEDKSGVATFPEAMDTAARPSPDTSFGRTQGPVPVGQAQVNMNAPRSLSDDGGTYQRVEDEAVRAEFAAIFRAEAEEQARLRQQAEEGRVDYAFGVWADAPQNGYTLRAEKSWAVASPYGVSAESVTLTLAEARDRSQWQPLADDLNTMVHAGDLEIAMRRAERMAVANGFLDPKRSDPRLFSDGPEDPFATAREMDIAAAKDRFRQFEEGYAAAEGANPPQIGEDTLDSAALEALEAELTEIEMALGMSLAEQDVDPPEPEVGLAHDAPPAPDLDF